VLKRALNRKGRPEAPALNTWTYTPDNFFNASLLHYSLWSIPKVVERGFNESRRFVDANLDGVGLYLSFNV
jgi:hypothetical protein